MDILWMFPLYLTRSIRSDKNAARQTDPGFRGAINTWRNN